MWLSASLDTETSPPIWEWRWRSSCSYSRGTSQVVSLATSRFLHTDTSLVLDLPRAREFHT